MADHDKQSWIGWKVIAWLVATAFSTFGVLYLLDPFGWCAANVLPVPQQQLPQADAPPRPPETGQNQSAEPSAYLPLDKDSPTPIVTQNTHSEDGIVQSVTFDIESVKETPHRFKAAGAEVMVPVNFRADNYDQRNRRFFHAFPQPPLIPANGFNVFQVAVVIPTWHGKTLVGTFTVFYNGGKTVAIHGVELDALRDTPPAQPVRGG